MSFLEPRPMDELHTSIPCARCEALPGQPCRTIAGRTTHTHSARRDPMDEAWHLGFRECLELEERKRVNP